MNITHVLLNNNELGKISKEQRTGHWPVWQTALTNLSFASYAEDCGAQGLRVERSDQIDGTLQAALEHGGPSVIEVIADAALT